MYNKKRIIAAILAFVSIACFARTGNRNVTINGCRADKTVTEISFDNDKVAIKWSDNTVMCDGVARVMASLISLEDIENTYIASVSGLQNNEVHVCGLCPGNPMSIYNIQGKKVMEAPVDRSSKSFDISKLNTGIYLLCQTELMIKFVKH